MSREQRLSEYQIVKSFCWNNGEIFGTDFNRRTINYFHILKNRTVLVEGEWVFGGHDNHILREIISFTEAKKEYKIDFNKLYPAKKKPVKKSNQFIL